METTDHDRDRRERRGDAEEAARHQGEEAEAAVGIGMREADGEESGADERRARAAEDAQEELASRGATGVELLLLGLAVRLLDRLAAGDAEGLHEFGGHLEEHEENADLHRDLDRGHVRGPDRVVDLLGDDGVGAAFPAADEHDGEIEEDEERGHRIDDGLSARLPVRVEEVHAHVGVLLE